MKEKILTVVVTCLTLATASCATLPAGDTHPLKRTRIAAERWPALDLRRIQIPPEGYVTAVYFWGTYCQPCHRTIRDLETLWKQKKHGGLAVIGVAVDDNPGLVVKDIAEMGVTFPTIMDGQWRKLQQQFCVEAIPTLFILDRQGMVRAVFSSGATDMSLVQTAVDYLIGENL